MRIGDKPGFAQLGFLDYRTDAPDYSRHPDAGVVSFRPPAMDFGDSGLYLQACQAMGAGAVGSFGLTAPGECS